MMTITAAARLAWARQRTGMGVGVYRFLYFDGQYIREGYIVDYFSRRALLASLGFDLIAA